MWQKVCLIFRQKKCKVFKLYYNKFIFYRCLVIQPLHKKWSFPLRTSLVNATRIWSHFLKKSLMENFVFVGRHELLLSPNYPHIQCSSIMIPKTLPVLSITLAKIPHHTFTFFQAWFTYDFLRRFPKKNGFLKCGKFPPAVYPTNLLFLPICHICLSSSPPNLTQPWQWSFQPCGDKRSIKQAGNKRSLISIQYAASDWY